MRSLCLLCLLVQLNTLRPRQNVRRFADDTFKRIFLHENVKISIKIPLKSVPKGPINNNPSLVQIMAWRRSGDKPLSEPMMVSLLTHICVTRPQWVKLFASNNVSSTWMCDFVIFNHSHCWNCDVILVGHAYVSYKRFKNFEKLELSEPTSPFI